MCSIGVACLRRIDSALLANSTVVEINAEVFSDVLDLNDQLRSLFSLFNTARYVPVQVDINVELCG
jgi:hypothetical protein